MPKPPGIKRVFVLGESVATLLEHGQALAPGEDPDPRLKAAGTSPWLGGGGGKAGIEVFNCGMGGYESRRIGEVLREVLNYSPDLLVVLSGNNEGYPEQFCPGLKADLRRRAFRLSEIYNSILHGPREGRAKATLNKHREELTAMARAAKKAGVPVVFCTLPANLRDMPARSRLPLQSERLARGFNLFHKGNYGAALEQFRLGLAASPSDHFLNFYAAKVLDNQGRPAEAMPYYLAALRYAYDDPTRATPERNDLIRETAGAEGACVADLDKLFLRLARGRVPGFAQFTDGAHWRPRYNKAVWDEIFGAAAACGIKGFAGVTAADRPRWAESAREDSLKRLGYVMSWLPERDLDEAVLAELGYIEKNDPSLLKAAAASPEALRRLVPRNFWSEATVSRSAALFPRFLAHLAEARRREISGGRGGR